MKKMNLVSGLGKLALIALMIFTQSNSHSQTIQLDASFGNGGTVITEDTLTTEINQLVLSDNKIIAVGYSVYMGDINPRVIKYNTDGTLDGSFGNGGIVKTDIGQSSLPYSAALQADGKLVVAGCYSDNPNPPFNQHSFLLRYNVNGTLDNTFGIGGIVKLAANPSEDGISSIFINPDGKIVAGGWSDVDFLVMRFNSNGTLDNSFGTGGKVVTSLNIYSFVYSIKRQADGKIVASGTTGSTSSMEIIGDITFALVRYNSDGTLDNSFGTGGKVVTDFTLSGIDVASLLEIQNDGKIVAAGYSNNNAAMARYLPNGTLDNSFGTNGQFLSDGQASTSGLAIQADGKYILTGNKEVNDYDYGWNIMRINQNGTVDAEFGDMGNFTVNIKPGSDYAQYVLIQPDNKILVGGSSRNSNEDDAHMTMLRLTTEPLSVSNVEKESTLFEMYPNPMSAYLTISSKDGFGKEFIVLYDVNGRQVLKSELTSETSQLNVGGLQNGIYFYQVLSNGVKLQEGKLTKQ